MTFLQAMIFAIIQGLTELFPVSSLGHAVVLPAILGWHIDQDSPRFLPFLVVLHVGTAAALLCYFWREWVGLLLAVFGRNGRGASVAEHRRLILLLIIGTLPAVLLGLIFEKWLRHLFGSPRAAAAFLIVNGFILFFGERLRRRADIAGGRRRLTNAAWRDALAVGLWQTAAFFPGFRAPGATIVGGLLVGWRHEDAARFSFLLATPVIAGAAALEIPKLLRAPAELGAAGLNGGGLWIAGLAAAVTAYTSTAFLMRYFRKREENQALDPFAYYCWAAGALALFYLARGF